MGRRRLWRGLLLALGAVLIVVGAGIALVSLRATADLSGAAFSLRGELAAARRENLPLEAVDLRRDPPVPDERNAAPYLREMARLHAEWLARKPDNAGEVLKSAYAVGRTDADRAAVRALLADRSRLLDLARKAASLPDCDLRKPYEKGPNVEFPELAATREGARLLAMQAMLSADDGKLAAAFHDIGLGAQIGRHAGREPVPIALLVRIAVEAIMDRAFTAIVLDHMDNQAAMRLSRETLSTFGDVPDLAYACRGEVIMGRVGIDMLRKGQSPESVLGSEAATSLYRLGPFRSFGGVFADASEARVVAFWRTAYARFREHPGDYAAQRAALRELERETEKRAKAPSYVLLNMLVPVFSEVAGKIGVNDAQRRLREGLVRIVEHRNRTGRFPAALADTGGATLTDPFSGKPLRYRRTGDGFVLYSVGMDRRDDGGDGRRPKGGGLAPDIVIRYPRTDP